MKDKVAPSKIRRAQSTLDRLEFSIGFAFAKSIFISIESWKQNQGIIGLSNFNFIQPKFNLV